MSAPAAPPPAASVDPIVYVVDDDNAIAAAIRGLLRSVGVECLAFQTAQDFLAHRRAERPSCLVLDVRLQGSSGLALQQTLIQRCDPIPIIFMTGHGDIPMIVQVMKAGAVDFLTKPFRDQEFLDTVSATLDRDRARRQHQQFSVGLHCRFQTLSAREREVMTLAASGLMNRQIADTVGISEVTVKIHRGNAMRKMEVRTFAELVLMAQELGVVGEVGASGGNGGAHA